MSLAFSLKVLFLSYPNFCLFFFQFCTRCLDTAYFAIIFVQEDKACKHKSLWNSVERKTLKLGSFIKVTLNFFEHEYSSDLVTCGKCFSQCICWYQMSVSVSTLLPGISWEIHDTKENNKILVAIEYKRLMGVFDIVYKLKLLNCPLADSNR